MNYQGKCAHLHGHNAVAEVAFSSSTLDGRGMVIDFEDIKTLVQSFLDEELDHKVILAQHDPFVALLKKEGEPVTVTEGNPTAENIARLIFDFAKKKGMPVSSVKLWETPTSCAEYSL